MQTQILPGIFSLKTCTSFTAFAYCPAWISSFSSCSLSFVSELPSIGSELNSEPDSDDPLARSSMTVDKHLDSSFLMLLISVE